MGMLAAAAVMAESSQENIHIVGSKKYPRHSKSFNKSAQPRNPDKKVRAKRRTFKAARKHSRGKK